MDVILVQSEYYNGVYEDEQLVDEGKGCYVNIETLWRTYKRNKNNRVRMYWMPDDVYDEILNGNGYPPFEELPLDRLQLRHDTTNPETYE